MFPLSQADQHSIVDIYYKNRLDNSPSAQLNPEIASLLYEQWRAEKELIDSHCNLRKEESD